MVVILFLTPHTANSCDGGSDESGTLSTTSTGATAIPSETFRTRQKEHQRNDAQPHTNQFYLQAQQQQNHSSDTSQCYITQLPIRHPSTSRHHTNYFKDPPRKKTLLRTNSRRNYTTSTVGAYKLSPKPPPPPPPSTPSASSAHPPPKYKRLHEALCPSEQIQKHNRVNVVPKPPRGKPLRNQRVGVHRGDHRSTAADIHNDTVRNEALPSAPCGNQYLKSDNKENIFNHLHGSRHQTRPTPFKITNFSDTVRHVTRVNFYDIDTLQVEFEPKDEDSSGTEAITKEEEWITKKKTELTTTRQIETRVKRQVVLADGKVVEDSGPIVSTNTTEDTDKQETETTEKHDLGNPDNQLNVSVVTHNDVVEDGPAVRQQVLAMDAKAVARLVPRPVDGLVRETNEKRVITHKEKKDYLETEDVQHLGDFSDETYINAINNSADNLTETLLSATNIREQSLAAPTKVIANTNKSYKTIDTEDILKRCFAQPDGTLITENENTTKHEVIVDKDLPEKDDHSRGSREKLTTVEAHQRFFKQKDTQNVDLLVDGKVIGTEMRYTAETMQLEKDGSLERPGDWDSLSDRMRKLRRPPKSLLQQQKEAALLLDRKDALTKRPLDFDREEETRKGETMKWLESHFGSESTASNDSRDETEVEPTKRTFFNVTIKSSHPHNDAPAVSQRLLASKVQNNEYQETGDTITSAAKTRLDGTDRKNPTTHFATKAFQDDLKETVERNRLKKNPLSSSGDQLHSGTKNVNEDKDNYVSRDDILHQKRQSLSSQFLARSKNGRKDTPDYINCSPADTRLGLTEEEKRFQSNIHVKKDIDFIDPKSELDFLRGSKVDYELSRARKSVMENGNFDSLTVPRKSYETQKYRKDSALPSPDLLQMQSKTMDRPTVPARKRTIEKKLRQVIRAPSESTAVAFEQHTERVEPPPDYSPPPRSHSTSPRIEYIASSSYARANAVDASSYTANAVVARKLNQRTRFAPSSLTPHTAQVHHSERPKMSTQTTQTTPSTISTSTAASHKSNKVGQAIGNSIRKLVSKIRSVSAERKFRMKTKNKSPEQSPAVQATDKLENNAHSTTYQQYNLIDTHIGSQSNDYGSDQDYAKQHQLISSTQAHTHPHTHAHSFNNSSKMESANLMHTEKVKTLRRLESTDPYASQHDLDGIGNPRQRYYLGEDPYSSTLYGKENLYDFGPAGKQNREHNGFDFMRRNHRGNEPKVIERPKELNRYTSSNTLGRYQKSGQRLVGSTPNLTHNHRTAKTLPRKLADHPEHELYSGRKVNGWPQAQTGPVKPARTFSKSLSRSKSFNLHGLNEGADKSLINNGKQRNYQNLNVNIIQKRNPYSMESSLLQSGLKSPSIVNLVSRSQKDLTKVGNVEDERDFNKYSERPGFVRGLSHNEPTEKKIIFLKGLHQQAPDLYKTLHADDDFRYHDVHKYPLETMHSLDSKSPIQINKDTASILRGDIYGPGLASKKKIHLYMDENQRRGSGSTVIAINRK